VQASPSGENQLLNKSKMQKGRPCIEKGRRKRPQKKKEGDRDYRSATRTCWHSKEGEKRREALYAGRTGAAASALKGREKKKKASRNTQRKVVKKKV